jgi:hypothetical protein
LGLIGAGDLREGDFQFVESVMAGLVDARRLAGRADEEAGEEIGQRRMTLPVDDEAFEQIGAADEGESSSDGPPSTI